MALSPEQLKLAAEELASAARDGDRQRAQQVTAVVVAEQGDSISTRADLATRANLADAEFIGQAGTRWPA